MMGVKKCEKITIGIKKLLGIHFLIVGKGLKLHIQKANFIRFSQ